MKQHAAAPVLYRRGLVFHPGENVEQVKYQAAHHELVASAKAVKLAHEKMPDAMVGCMLAAGQFSFDGAAHPLTASFTAESGRPTMANWADRR